MDKGNELEMKALGVGVYHSFIDTTPDVHGKFLSCNGFQMVVNFVQRIRSECVQGQVGM